MPASPSSSTSSSSSDGSEDMSRFQSVAVSAADLEQAVAKTAELKARRDAKTARDAAGGGLWGRNPDNSSSGDEDEAGSRVANGTQQKVRGAGPDSDADGRRVQLDDALALIASIRKGATRTVQIAQSLRNVLDSLIDLGEEGGADPGSEETERRKTEKKAKKEKRRKDDKAAGESSALQNSDEDVTFRLFSRIPETPRQPKSSSKAKTTMDGGECSRAAAPSASLGTAAPTAQRRDSHAGPLREPALATVAVEGREILSRAASHAYSVNGLQSPVSVPKPANERCVGRGKAHVRAQLRLGCLCPHTACLLGKKGKKKRASSAVEAESGAPAGLPTDELAPEFMSKQQRKKARRRAAKEALKIAKGDQGTAAAP